MQRDRRATSIIYPRLRTDLQGPGMICGVNARAGAGEGWKEGWYTMEMRDVSLSSHVFVVACVTLPSRDSCSIERICSLRLVKLLHSFLEIFLSFLESYLAKIICKVNLYTLNLHIERINPGRASRSGREERWSLWIGTHWTVNLIGLNEEEHFEYPVGAIGPNLIWV